MLQKDAEGCRRMQEDAGGKQFYFSINTINVIYVIVVIDSIN
jgi:hypothetical protein